MRILTDRDSTGDTGVFAHYHSNNNASRDTVPMNLDSLSTFVEDWGNPDHNLLNGLTPDTQLFRFFPIGRFFEMVRTRSIWLCRPRKWDDPFENFLERIPVYKALSSGFFGQCWTLNCERDTYWRNFCSIESGVRVETTAGRLIRAVWVHPHPNLQCSVGRVQYKTESEIKSRLADGPDYHRPLCDNQGLGIHERLLDKRTEFAHEEEVRVLVDDPDAKEDFKTFSVNPIAFIQSIKFAPKMHCAHSVALRNWLVKTGFAKHTISQSTLYQPWSRHAIDSSAAQT